MVDSGHVAPSVRILSVNLGEEPGQDVGRGSREDDC